MSHLNEGGWWPQLPHSLLEVMVGSQSPFPSSVFFHTIRGVYILEDKIYVVTHQWIGFNRGLVRGKECSRT